MPQTKFVLRKAFACHIRPIVVINKVDRPDARPNEVLNEVFDTFVELGASEEQLDFSYIFASGKAGFASHDPAATSGNVGPLFDLIIDKVPGPVVDPDGPFAVLCTTLDFSEYVGRIAIGRIVSGKVRRGQKAALLKANGVAVNGSIDGVLLFDKLGRVEVAEAEAGDIVAIVGLASRRDRRHDRGARANGGAAAHRGRRAHVEHALHRQQLAPCRRGAVSDLAAHQRSSGSRTGVERRPARRAHRRW